MTDIPNEAWRDLNAAAQTVREVGEKVDRDREANERAAALNEQRIAASVRKFRAWRFAGLVGIALSVLALWAGWRADTAIDRINSSRAEARIAACEAYNNDLATSINGLNDRTQDLLVNAAAGGERTAAEQARTDQFVAQERAEFERIKLKLRDCSPAGIAAYYKAK